MHVHLIGVAGTGMSALAALLVEAGHRVSGSDIAFDPPVNPGKYTYKFEVATDGGQMRQVKTYTAGRITGMKYEQGNTIVIIGDSLAVPMSQLIQIRG